MCKKHINHKTCNKPTSIKAAKSGPRRLQEGQQSAALTKLAKPAFEGARRATNSRAGRCTPWIGPDRISSRRKPARVAKSAQAQRLPNAIELIAACARAIWARGIIYCQFKPAGALQAATPSASGPALVHANALENHTSQPRPEALKRLSRRSGNPYTSGMSEHTPSIADLRKSYERAELNEAASNADPLNQFDQWLGEAIAAQLPEPNAMTLATVGGNLRPSTRVVLIKGFDARGIVWYTNYDSRKGQELAGNPYAALQFHWVELERVVRIEGVVEKVSDEESDAYFHSRPLDSRIGAWASPQSEVISGRSVLLANAAKYGAKFLLQPPRPPHWGGYRLKPDNWQFWQGRKSRLHDRLRYTLQLDAGWLRERLAP